MLEKNLPLQNRVQRHERKRGGRRFSLGREGTLWMDMINMRQHLDHLGEGSVPHNGGLTNAAQGWEEATANSIQGHIVTQG